MNKKIYGLMAFGVATGFWACGSGDIIKPDQYDELMASQVQDDPNAMGGVNDILNAVKCPECFAGQVPSSSSVTPPPQPQSSSAVVPPPGQSSSSRTVRYSSSTVSSSSFSPFPFSGSSSSAAVPTSSSNGGTNPGTDKIGTCAPIKAIVDKDSSVVWKFTRDPAVDPQQLMNASFNWSMPGATPATASASGANGLSQKVQYATSGVHKATVVVSIGAASYTVECAPVQKNGDEIKGCECSTEATSVDFTATPEVSWSVAGCTSGPGLTFSYEWEGTLGEATFTKTLTAATPSYAPTLRVANSDNTVINVTCPAIKVTEGPEYTIKATQGDGAIKLPAGSTLVSLEVDAYNSTVFCQVARADVPSGALKGSVNSVEIDGSDYIAVKMPAGTLVKGATLTFELDGPATCGVQ